MTSSKTLWTMMVAGMVMRIANPQGAELMDKIANRLDEDDILFLFQHQEPGLDERPDNDQLQLT
jgi:hypothetical protein